MHPALEEIFRFREECDLEVDPEVKEELIQRFRTRLDSFLRQHQIVMTRADFLAATREAYKHWRRNPH
jgi:hypothetical protein